MPTIWVLNYTAIFLLALLPWIGVIPCRAESANAMVYVLNGPQSPADHRYDFHWEILKTALERTVAKHGPYRIEKSAAMSEARQTQELQDATGKLTVMYLGTSPELERDLIPVRIPVDKNLSGYFVLLIRSENAAKFRDAQTLEGLKKFTFGLGVDWLDNLVYEHNGLRVTKGSEYDGLFEMLLNSRFDAFPRSGVEVMQEYTQRRAAMPDLFIEETLLIYYPWPMYFWFSKNAEGLRLSARAAEGMWSMIEDGTYNKIFEKHFHDDIERLNLKKRKLIELKNPRLTPATPLQDKRLWFVPTASESKAK